MQILYSYTILPGQKSWPLSLFCLWPNSVFFYDKMYDAFSQCNEVKVMLVNNAQCFLHSLLWDDCTLGGPEFTSSGILNEKFSLHQLGYISLNTVVSRYYDIW